MVGRGRKVEMGDAQTMRTRGRSRAIAGTAMKACAHGLLASRVGTRWRSLEVWDERPVHVGLGSGARSFFTSEARLANEHSVLVGWDRDGAQALARTQPRETISQQ